MFIAFLAIAVTACMLYHSQCVVLEIVRWQERFSFTSSSGKAGFAVSLWSRHQARMLVASFEAYSGNEAAFLAPVVFTLGPATSLSPAKLYTILHVALRFAIGILHCMVFCSLKTRKR